MTILEDASSVLTLAAVLGAAFAVARGQHQKQTLEAIKSGNEELRAELSDERTARKLDNDECTRRLDAQAAVHSVEIAEVRGQMRMLTADFATVLAPALAAAVVPAVLAGLKTTTTTTLTMEQT